MPILRQLCIYCCISGTFLFSLACAMSLKTNKTVFGNVSYEFCEKLQSWAQARDACENQGRKLLTVLDCKIKDFLMNASKDLQTTAPAWWVDKGLMGFYNECKIIQGTQIDKPDVEEIASSPHFCTYVIMDPFQLVTTPYCNMTLGYLCTLGSKTDKAEAENGDQNQDENRRKRRSERVRRSTDDPDISYLLIEMDKKTDLALLLTSAEKILHRLEDYPVLITHDGKKRYLVDIYEFLKTLKTIDGPSKDLTINCTRGLTMHILEHCDEDNSPENLEELFILAVKIYQQINILLNQDTSQMYVWEIISGTLFATKREQTSLNNMLIGSEEKGFIQFPSYSALQSQLSPGPVNVQMVSYKMNPLNMESNFSITGTVCSLSLSSTTSDIKLSNLSDFIEIFLPRPEAPEPRVTEMSMKLGFAIITSFNISDVNSTVIVTAIPDQNVSLQLSLSKTYQSTNRSQRTILTKKDSYRWLIHPEMMNSTSGTWYVNITPFNYTSSQPVKINVTVLNFKCVFWDTELNEWSREGCWVGPKTVPNMTHCLCNHNTFYGSSFFVMPNHVDLTQTAALFATVKENYVVVTVLCAFFLLYLIIALYAWYSDRKALRTRKITPLEDNHPCAHYNYLLNIQTGNRKGAGTSAKVMMTIEGADGESDPHHLSDPDQPVFEKGGADMFLLGTPFSLGELKSIKVWHDSTGGHPDWFLQKVTVQDLQTRQVWHFLSSTWLTGNGDVPCKRTFNPAKKNEITNFGNIFQARTSTGFRDEHIWMSIVNPPRHSPFTRVQRISCCMSLLLCTMVINIMFWNIPKDGQSPVIIKIGSFQLTWQQLMIAVESALLMFPINILIVTIFRSITPRVIPTDKSKTNNSNKPPASMQTILKDTQEIVNLLSKSPKNHVMAMQHNPETTADLFAALNQMHDLIMIIQGQTDGEQHWAHCSRFVLHSLCHLSMLLDRAAEKVFSHPEDFELAKNTVNMMLKKAEMLSTSNPVHSPAPEPEKKKKAGCKLPWWFVFVGWGLLLCISVVSTFFTLLYGFQYGKESSIQWLITLTLSLFQSIFIIQPLKVVGLAIFFALILRPVAVEDSTEVDLLLEEQREKCESYCGRQMH